MKSILDLTATARRHAAEAGLLDRLERLQLQAWVGRGDLIELRTGMQRDTFVVRARRVLVAEDGDQTLVFELDYPPRPPPRG